MSSGPRLLEELGQGWSLRAWDFPGADLELYGPTVTVTRPGGASYADRDYLEVEVQRSNDEPGRGDMTTTVRIPIAAMVRLLADPEPTPSE